MKKVFQIALLAFCALFLIGEGGCFLLGAGMTMSSNNYDRGLGPLFLLISGVALLITALTAWGIWRWYRKNRPAQAAAPADDPEP